MTIRLPHIAMLIVLCLLAGVLSVRHLEDRLGGALVPGLVLVDAPWAGEQNLALVRAAWPEAELERVASSAEPLEPFGSAFLARVAARGDHTVLCSIDPALTGGEHWSDVVNRFPELAGRPPSVAVVERAAEFVRTQVRPSRSFLVAVAFGMQVPPDLRLVIDRLMASVLSLPAFRRSAVVLLGGPVAEEPGRRWVLRLDAGRWADRGRPGLADLLESRW